MSKKESTVRERNYFVKLCAFLGLFLSAVLFVMSGFFSGQVNAILDLVARLSLLVAIAVPAYSFVRGRHVAWKVVYWIVLVIYVLGCVFGVLHGFNVFK